jgi:uncharacterized protein
MDLTLRQPILVGGLGLTLSLGLLEILHPASTNFTGTVVWTTIAIGSGVWWLKQRVQKPLNLSLSPQVVDRTAVEKAFTEVQAFIDQLVGEAAASPETASDLGAKFQQQLADLKVELERKEIRLAIVGGKESGKTALKQQLIVKGLPKGSPELPTKFLISDTPGLFGEEAERIQSVVAPVVHDADLVLFVTTGDLTCSELETLQQWIKQQQRLILVLSKQDRCLPTERPLVLQQLRQRVQPDLPPADVVAIAAAPSVLKVRQHQPDGVIQERQEQPEPDLTALTDRLGQTLTQSGQPLVFTTVLRQTKALKKAIVTELNQVRRDRALPLIEQSQWIAAATAFANPVPSLDLIATAAINAQLVLDLGTIYQQNFSLQQAKTVASTLASLMVKLGLVELSSQAIAPLLKSNVLTYMAGGLLQGVSAAYLTRIAGLSLVAYFEEQSQNIGGSSLQIDRLMQKLQAVFQDNQRIAFLQTLVKQGIDRFAPAQQSPAANLSASASASASAQA